MKYLLLFITILSFISSAETRYVSKSGLSIPGYFSWETAADSIQKCLDICNDGDTVYVGAGVYKESLIINKEIWLIGISMDSTIIDGAGLAEFTVFNPTNVRTLNLQNFTVLGAGAVGGSTTVRAYGNININSCKIKRAYGGVGARGGVIHNVLITDVQDGITGGCLIDTCHFLITNNIIMPNYVGSAGISMIPGGYYKVYNNVIITAVYNSNEGIILDFPHIFDIRNNLIAGFNVGINQHCWDTSYSYNNYITNCKIGINLSSAEAITKNCIITNTQVGFWSLTAGSVLVDYNLLWQYGGNIGTMTWGDSNKIADPMVVDNKIPDTSLVYDLHLQKYSPAIDAGDPNVLDLDGTRSDAGLYGGIYGETYEYKDLAPKAPKNFTATVTSGQILFKWNKNTEADTAYYSIYMDSTQNFTIDTTKLLKKITGTLFSFLSPQVNKPLYFKITATDNQGNQSLPSEELYIFINVTGEQYPKEISSYQLYKNYPNPFNPSTTISYKLKESGYVKLLIYDIKGELIKVLVNQEQESGYYETEFDASGLASGIYIYRLEVIGKGNIPVYSDMKKMILLK